MNASRRVHTRRDWRAQRYRCNVQALKIARHLQIKPRDLPAKPDWIAFHNAIKRALDQWKYFWADLTTAVNSAAKAVGTFGKAFESYHIERNLR